eukprot:5021647-Alexandrium_andersonii.AAC.1
MCIRDSPRRLRSARSESRSSLGSPTRVRTALGLIGSALRQGAGRAFVEAQDGECIRGGSLNLASWYRNGHAA